MIFRTPIRKAGATFSRSREEIPFRFDRAGANGDRVGFEGLLAVEG
ncbi:hypothetical protein V0288_20135 [Pannus brasiliensis CCIBt3594]|uniref:Uncharacterized protein n=1 Tax=Pannus brasiliensis CCIBt3594 TaxID=1427578 RepID=A0AAW9QYI9_9CHRO